MTRWLAIDHGEKRIGIAITDPLKMFVTPYQTIENKSDDSVFEELKRIFASQNVEKIIIGLPLNIEGEDTPKTIEVREFYKKLSEKTDLTLVLWDERYSTCEANEILKNKGKNWKESRNVVDQIAAAVILKSYIEDCKI
ncbi:MAG: Holliday junction resolvase RuvX [Candidatus Cloacimonetes bacterium]|nr:Holliday junction resolvase RuvX [Candidatus Cloacimonadota bacterium]